MSIFAIADLHLAIACPEKDMKVFGANWEGYMDQIAVNWRSAITDDDLVLLPGDISWAMRSEDAQIDLKWIDALPGKKVMIRGNHDLWWASLKKVREICPPSITPLHHTATLWNGTAIAGTRLWDSPEEYSFRKYTDFELGEEDKAAAQKIFERELGRLELACQALDKSAHRRIVMTHYPPISSDLTPSRASAILEKHKIDICCFGHLHNIAPDTPMFGEHGGVTYVNCAADYVNFSPVLLQS
jgi:uncharacterized protein